jgi:hypothetical protein
MSEQLTNGEIAVLSAARSILTVHAKYGYDDAATAVHAAAIAEVAEAAIFNYLNTEHNMNDVPMTYEQLHNRQAPVTA